VADDFTDRLVKMSEAATCRADIDNILAFAAKAGQTISYSNRLYVVSAIVFAAGAAFSTIVLPELLSLLVEVGNFYSPDIRPPDTMPPLVSMIIALTIPCIIVLSLWAVIQACIYFGRAIKHSMRVLNIGPLLLRLDIMLDNDLSYAPTPSFNELDQRYCEFARGNRDREIEYYVYGETTVQETKLCYHIYKFRYEIRIKGGVTSFYRYGLILDGFTTQNIQIFSDSTQYRLPVNWTTESIEFNKQFKIHATDEMTIAKFLQPTVILAIENFSNSFKKVNIEVDDSHHLCISFEDTDLLPVPTSRLIDLQNLTNSMKGKTKLPSLDQVLDFAHTLMASTDNNFAGKI
jgi:fumarate reductase subunit D